MSTLNEVKAIRAEIAELEARAALLITEGRDEAITTIQQMMQDYTITATDLGLTLKAPPRKRDGSVNPRPPKYRDPESGLTWTGQGAQPKWMDGKPREEFLIKEGNTP